MICFAVDTGRLVLQHVVFVVSTFKKVLSQFASAAFEWNSKVRDRMSKKFRKPDSDELNGPFSSGFLNAPAAVNNSVRFSVSGRKTETKNFHQHLPTSLYADRQETIVNKCKNIESTFNKSTKPRKSEISPLTFS